MNERPLTPAESQELKAMHHDPEADAERYIELLNQCLLYGDSTAPAIEFTGLEPRYGER